MKIEGKAKTETVVTLTLDQEEAEWLMGYLQNCMEPEAHEDFLRRGAIFDGIREALRGDALGKLE